MTTNKVELQWLPYFCVCNYFRVNLLTALASTGIICEMKNSLHIFLCLFLSVIYIIPILCSTQRSKVRASKSREEEEDCRQRWRRSWQKEGGGGEMGENSDSDVKSSFAFCLMQVSGCRKNSSSKHEPEKNESGELFLKSFWNHGWVARRRVENMKKEEMRNEKTIKT